MKLIREARMGPPKSFKTGAIVGTYPKPLLYLGFDQGGIDVIPSKAVVDSMLPNGPLIKPNCCYEDIEFVRPGFLEVKATKPITAIQYWDGFPLALTLDIKPTPSEMPINNFLSDFNKIAGSPRESFPWKTVCLDGCTGLTDAWLSWMAARNPGLLAKAWDWVPICVAKVRQACFSLNCLPCHSVVLLHSYLDKNETTGEVSEKPNLYGKEFRDEFFGLFSQCFYSVVAQDGKPKLWVSTKYPVKGIGPRWPLGLPQEINPDFQSIYGKELV